MQRLELNRRDVAEGLVEAVVVEPADVFDGSKLELGLGAPSSHPRDTTRPAGPAVRFNARTMLAILGGLGAALAWACATLCASRASRQIGPVSTFAWIAIVGLVIALPMVADRPVPTLTQIGWLALAGVATAIGLVSEYTALRLGQVGVVTPISSTEGAIAAMIAIAAGEQLAPLAAAAVLVVAAGVVLVAWPGGGVHGSGKKIAEGSALAGLAAIAFGLSLYATGHVSYLALGWLVIPTRLIGVVFVALPLVVRGRLRLTRSIAPLVVTAGTCEVIGLSSYALGSRHGIAIAAVLASLFALFASVGAYLFLSERLGQHARIGVLVTALGVATISVVH